MTKDSQIKVLRESIRNHTHMLYREDAEKLAEAIWQKVQEYLAAMPEGKVDLDRCKQSIFEYDPTNESFSDYQDSTAQAVLDTAIEQLGKQGVRVRYETDI